MKVGDVIDKVQETIASGLEDEAYSYEWDAEVTGLVPFFGDEWADLPEGEFSAGRRLVALSFGARASAAAAAAAAIADPGCWAVAQT